MLTSTTSSTQLSYKGNIINAVINRVKFLLHANTSAQITDTFISELSSFLLEKDFYGGINVFLSKEPITDDVEKFSLDDTYDIAASFGKNNRKEMYPYLLSLSVSKKPIVLFKRFWEHRACPSALFEEATAKLDLNLPVYITMFQSLHIWNEYRKNSENCEFIGQTPDEKSGLFIPSIPIGYVDRKSNSVIMTNPELSRSSVCYTFNFRKK